MNKVDACTDNNILVSVICNAYNQEDYIADAIESFMMQKTSFTFEVLVHDDASTDKTAEIIRRFESEYPETVKPIYRTENCYSRGIPNGQMERAKGKYIAICEGDDYWIDPYKLQRQVELLEKHPECDICTHSAYVVNAETKKRTGKIAPRKMTGIIDVKDVIEGGGGFVATNSILVRRSIFDEPPAFRQYYKIDYSLQIAASLRGGMLYIPEYMSAYRYMAKSSWSVRMHSDVEKYCAAMDKLLGMLQRLDQETEGKYNQSIKTMIKKYTVDKLEMQGNYEEIFENYKDVIKNKPLKSKIILYIKKYLPLVQKIRNGRNNDK